MIVGHKNHRANYLLNVLLIDIKTFEYSVSRYVALFVLYCISIVLMQHWSPSTCGLSEWSPGREARVQGTEYEEEIDLKIGTFFLMHPVCNQRVQGSMYPGVCSWVSSDRGERPARRCPLPSAAVLVSRPTRTAISGLSGVTPPLPRSFLVAPPPSVRPR